MLSCRSTCQWLHHYFLGFYSTDCSEWKFFSKVDPTEGYVNYLTKEEAIQNKLAIVQDNVTILSADYTTMLNAGAMRNS